MLTDQMPQEIAEMYILLMVTAEIMWQILNDLFCSHRCVREKMLEHLPAEIPYELGLKTSHWEVDDNDCLNIIINVIPGTTKYKYNRHIVI